MILNRKVPNKPESCHHKEVLHILKDASSIFFFFLSEYFYEIAMGFVDSMLKSNDMHDKFLTFVHDKKCTCYSKIMTIENFHDYVILNKKGHCSISRVLE